MAEKNWKKIRIQRCEHAGCDVALEIEEVYPADHLPDQPPRISGHRCSHGIDCMMLNNPACLWSGGDSGFDPFRE
jgi:hypothetical protein